MFYPDVKPHISPSALDNWHNSQAGFIKSYFEGVRIPDTAAMAAGKRVHALIEGGFIKAQKCFKNPECDLKIEIRDGILVFGKPDSYEGDDKEAIFVDYKTGRENNWDAGKLATDIKMRTTAWLVWKKLGCPKKVTGFIEYIPTMWDADNKEVVPTGGPSTLVEYVYSGADLEKFTQFILESIDEINNAYERWLVASDVYVNPDDIEKYLELEGQLADLDEQQSHVKERIASQIEFAGGMRHKSDAGTFFFSTKEAYSYPGDLKFTVGDREYSLEEADKIGAAAKAAKQLFEMENEPVSVTRVFQFRSAKKNAKNTSKTK